MKQLYKFFTLLCLFFSMRSGYAERGIVVAVNDYFFDAFFWTSLTHLRVNLNCELPMEIWYSGDELSEENKKILKQYPKISLKDIAGILNVHPNEYRGFQIKPKMIELSDFDEVILMDADVFFFENPALLFDHPGYVSTGAFFFHDVKHLFPVENNNVFTLDSYLNRRSFIRSLVPVPSGHVPQHMDNIWTDEVPTFQHPFVGDFQESGCIAMNKRVHKKSLELCVQLNENRKETYKYIHGDKETFWMGCEMAKAPYHMNTQRAYSLKEGGAEIPVIQFVDEKLFYQQRYPIHFSRRAQFSNHEGDKRSLTEEEHKKIELALYATKLRKKYCGVKTVNGR